MLRLATRMTVVSRQSLFARAILFIEDPGMGLQIISASIASIKTDTGASQTDDYTSDQSLQLQGNIVVDETSDPSAPNSAILSVWAVETTTGASYFVGYSYGSPGEYRWTTSTSQTIPQGTYRFKLYQSSSQSNSVPSGATLLDSSTVVTIDTTAPTATLPSAQYDPISGDGTIVFGSVHGNRITVSDNNDDKLTVRITVQDGWLNLNGPMLNVTVFGLNTPQLTITGLAKDINTALNNHLSYTTLSFKVGAADSMRVEATDLAGNLSSASIEIDVTCFMAGTRIKTPTGEAAVETLRHGDLVLTADGRSLPVIWLGRQTVSTVFGDAQRVLPIRIKAGALADNVPARDLLISPDHAILIDGFLAQAAALVNGLSIVRETAVPSIFTYYHVELEEHALILAENTPAETFVDNADRMRFDNWDEHLALYPEGKAIDELAYARAKSLRQTPARLRVELAERARLIGAASQTVA
jgi:hypothetical protein